MEDVIREIRSRLLQNGYPTEATVRQGIVLNLLGSLGWSVYDVDIVWPDYVVGKQTVDYGLCRPRRDTRILIHTRSTDGTRASNEQEVLEGAFLEGISLVVFTSGQKWDFYAPYDRNALDDCLVFHLDLLRVQPHEARTSFERYLSINSWPNSGNNKAIMEEISGMAARRQTRLAAPEVWNSLLTDPSDELLELMARGIKSNAGFQPVREELEKFLKTRINEASAQHREPDSVDLPEKRRQRAPKKYTNDNPRLWINGTEQPVANHRDRYVQIMSYLARRDPQFLVRYSALFTGKKRPNIAQTPEALFPQSPQLLGETNHWKSVPGIAGWFLDVNKSALGFEDLIKQACEVAGVRFGKDIRIN